MALAADPKTNHLLAALPDDIWKRWLPQLELVEMPLGQVLYEAGVTLAHGNEGVVGISIFMGGESTPSRAVVQSAGQGFQLKSQAMKDEFIWLPVLHLMLRYTQALITQMAQTAACNRHHSLDQRLCRWLLLSLDRIRSEELMMTRDLIANMLGVRREGVSDAAMSLQKAGLIQYKRGHITVLDRKGLEKRTCECYAVVKREYDRLLPDTVAT